MQATTKISPFQFYCVLFLSRVFSLVTYVSGIRGETTQTNEVISVILTAIFLLITAIPTALLIKTDSTQSVLTRAYLVSQKLQKVICIIYLISFIYKGIITAARFELLLGSVMFPETNVQLFVAILILAAVFTAHRGLEATGRASVLFLIPVLFAFFFVFLSLLKKFDILNFNAFPASDIPSVADGGFYSASRTGEIAMVAIFTPMIKKHKSKHLYIWIALISTLIIITETMISGVLGGFGQNQLFNMYSLSVLAEFGFIERTDAVISCLWMVCSVVKMTLILIACKTLLTSISNKIKPSVGIFGSAAVIFIGMMIISLSIVNFSDVIRSPLTVIFYILTVIVIPLAVIISEKLKEKRHEKA